MGRQRSSKGRSRKRGVLAPAGAPMIALPAELGIEQAAALHATLAPHLATREPVVLLAREVRRLHTATLQVLAAFFRTRAAANNQTAWQDPPALLRECAARLGLDSALQLTTLC